LNAQVVGEWQDHYVGGAIYLASQEGDSATRRKGGNYIANVADSRVSLKAGRVRERGSFTENEGGFCRKQKQRLSLDQDRDEDS